MEILSNRYTLELAPGGFPLSTDSMVLADFVRLPKAARVLDLGSGCGTLGLLLCAKDPDCSVTGIELDENAHRAASLQVGDRIVLMGRLQSREYTKNIGGTAVRRTAFEVSIGELQPL